MANLKRNKLGRFVRNKEDRHCLNCGKVLCRYGKSIRCKSCRNKYNHPKAGKGTLSDKGHKLITKKGKQIREHRYVWEKTNNMKIPKGFIIHHIDNNKINNKPDNLMLMSNAEHTSLHRAQRIWLGL
ncbi:HNH endonuclease [Candidatus Woesearchaeota archaeon]|nr:HNH endonuclease [Candidatus Woesearchaeota archaeon]